MPNQNSIWMSLSSMPPKLAWYMVNTAYGEESVMGNDLLSRFDKACMAYALVNDGFRKPLHPRQLSAWRTVIHAMATYHIISMRLPISLYSSMWAYPRENLYRTCRIVTECSQIDRLNWRHTPQHLHECEMWPYWSPIAVKLTGTPLAIAPLLSIPLLHTPSTKHPHLVPQNFKGKHIEIAVNQPACSELFIEVTSKNNQITIKGYPIHPLGVMQLAWMHWIAFYDHL